MQSWLWLIYTCITLLLWWLQSELVIRSIFFKFWLIYLLFRISGHAEEIFIGFKQFQFYPKLIQYIKKTSQLTLAIGFIYFAINNLPNLIAHQAAYQNAKDNNAIAWMDQESNALDKAKDLNKSLIIDFYADWCFPCKQMEINTFSDVEVQNILAESYVALKIDATKSSAKVQAILNKYQIKSFPSIVIISHQNQSTVKLSGYIDAYQLKKALNQHK